MRKRLIIAVTFIGGIYFIVEFLLPEYFPSGFGRDGAYRGIKISEYKEQIMNGVQAVGSGALALGLINIFRVFGVNVIKRRKGWPYSLTLVLAMLTMMTITFWTWSLDLSTQHQAGPFGTQSEFQKRILTYVGSEPSAGEPAAFRQRAMRDAPLLRYVADTRNSVAPPAVSAQDAAAQLEALAAFLKGAAPAPGFFKVVDAKENPPEYGADAPKDTPDYRAAEDFLTVPADFTDCPLQTPDAAARLKDLAKQRDELTDRLTKAGTALEVALKVGKKEEPKAGYEEGPKAGKKEEPKAGNKQEPNAGRALDALGPLLAAQAGACRELAPDMRKLSAEVRALADAEKALYAQPAEFKERYYGGPKPAPPPIFGRLYLAARALTQSAVILEKYAHALDLAATEIPAAQVHEQELADWLAERMPQAEALRQDWQKRAGADMASVIPVIRTKLGTPDALREGMLADLATVEEQGAASEEALTELYSTMPAKVYNLSPSQLIANTRPEIEAAAARALAPLKKQEPALRLRMVRSAAQDLSYLDLKDEDAAKLPLAALSAQAGSVAADPAPAVKALQDIATAAKDAGDGLSRRQKELETALETQNEDLRKTWKDKSSAELWKLRDAQNAQQKEIDALKARQAALAQAQKIATEMAGKVKTPPEIEALAKLPQGLAGAKNTLEAEALLAQTRQAVAGGQLFVLTQTAKILERFAFKHDMKDVREVQRARDSVRALTAAAKSEAALYQAAQNSRLAATALATQDLPAARKAMNDNLNLRLLIQARDGASEALQVNVDRSVAKGLYACLFQGLFVALGSAMFSLLAFYIASAAYRAFRIKSMEALLMMTAALLVMLGQIPFGAYIYHDFPQVRLWVLQVFSTPAFRGIALGAAVAFLAMAMRMWLSLETSAFYSEEEGK